mgnify:CR=1 FL=1
MTPEEIARYNKMMYMRAYRKNIKEKEKNNVSREKIPR